MSNPPPPLSVTLPALLYDRMARCYYGDGPRANGLVPAQENTDRPTPVTPDTPSSGYDPGSISLDNESRHWKPVGAVSPLPSSEEDQVPE